MADTTTTFKGLTKPEIGGSTGTWGTKINGDQDIIDDNLGRPQPTEVTAAAISSGVQALNLANGLVQKFTVTEAITSITFAGIPSGTVLVRLILQIVNPGAFAVTWPAAVTWVGAEPKWPASGTVYAELLTPDGGTHWFASVLAGAPLLPTGYIVADNLAVNAVTTAAIEDGAVTLAKLASEVIAPPSIRAKVKASAGQALSGETTLTFNTESGGGLYDTGGMHDNAVAPERLTVPASGGGLYEVIAQVDFSGANGAGTRTIRIYHNGVLRRTAQVYRDSGTNEDIFAAQVHLLAVAGDYFTVTAASTAAQSAAAGETSTFFQAARIQVT